jgi:hypothetical protein
MSCSPRRPLQRNMSTSRRTGQRRGLVTAIAPIPPGMVMNQVKGRRVHLALSGNTTEFEGNAKCESGW